jgi:hypothetical protein
MEAQHTLVLGRTGSGKTTFVVRFVLNSAAACAFVFDWNDRWPGFFRDRIGFMPFKVCHTVAECESALASRIVIFNPSRLFPGAMFDRKTGLAALRWFCSWVRGVSKRGPGRKLVCIAELWNFCTEDSIPAELAMLAQDGRQDEVSFVFDTQRPEKLNPSVTGAMTELVCFRLDEKRALKSLTDLGGAPEVVSNLPLGSFVSYGLDGGTLAGRVF